MKDIVRALYAVIGIAALIAAACTPLMMEYLAHAGPQWAQSGWVTGADGDTYHPVLWTTGALLIAAMLGVTICSFALSDELRKEKLKGNQHGKEKKTS